MSIKEIKQETSNTWRGLKKIWGVAVGVGEALAWVVLVALGAVISYQALHGEVDLQPNRTLLFVILASTIAVGMRMGWEFRKYARDLGKGEA